EAEKLMDQGLNEDASAEEARLRGQREEAVKDLKHGTDLLKQFFSKGKRDQLLKRVYESEEGAKYLDKAVESMTPEEKDVSKKWLMLHKKDVLPALDALLRSSWGGMSTRARKQTRSWLLCRKT
ncbi:unnamed protein product, partial [Symbiodinium pilosum]